ncbi:response regulator transcription factor [Mucilaginibacter sp. 14171R-50]|uniref:response regulator n=1 Tax=Mucilaginibacter sp. 14171R-50 TaxID=2703789 RepID=UPI00138B1EF5|nr:response regulator [Mucilaginibacter sp. 14171R-50]QHS56530.1 response regulator transcription factor [Mucilaginibacter sp. 14171R-50]
MLQTALIAEDHQNSNNWIRQTLKEMGIETVKHAYYCDDAYSLLKWGVQNGQAFDLLVTDLSFNTSGREQKLNGGAALIAAARDIQPDIKVLVFSAEQQETIITSLYQRSDINGYVCKGPSDAEDLKTAIESISKNKRYIPAGLLQQVRTKNAHDFSDYDIMVIAQLAKGTLQKNIPAYLQQQGIKANSLSSIEKRLNQIKDALGFTNNVQLIAYCKDYRII